MPIKIACIGLGWVSLHRHIPSIMHNDAFHLIGVIDRHPGRAATVAQRFKLPYSAETNDFDKIPWFDQVDAVAISTPPGTHETLVTHALAMGKHVITEKPFATSVAEGENMVRSAAEKGKTLAVVHNFQFGRAAEKLKRDLSFKKLGTINRVSAIQLGNPRRRLPTWFEELPGGLFFDESPHFFYLLRMIAGKELKLSHAHGIPSALGKKTPDAISLLYRAKNNLPVSIDCQFDSPLSEWYITVSGSEGMGIVDIFRDIYIHLPNDGAHGLFDILKTSALTIGQHFLQHIPNGIAFMRNRLDYGNDVVFDHFAKSIHSGLPPESISGEDALAVLKLQFEALSALQPSLQS